MQAVLAATKRSLAALRKRLGGSQAGGVFFLERPFFNISLQLSVPHVLCSPSLGDIQAAINAATKKVRLALCCSNRMPSVPVQGAAMEPCCTCNAAAACQCQAYI